jgi:hypothetical protein
VRRQTLFLVLSAVALTVVAVFIGVFAGVHEVRKLARNLPLKPHEEQVELTAIVTRVRDLNRLETAAMRVVHVSTTSQGYNLVPNTLGGDELTLMATGEVIAGLDLSQLRPTDVTRDADGTIAIRLPPPQILVSRIDNGQTRVLTRKTGLLRKSDKNLEGRARQYAEIGIRQEAMKRGILTLAQQNGERKLAELLHTFGAQRLRFIEPGSAPSLR